MSVSGMIPGVTMLKKDYAAHQGVSPGRVTQWKTAGQLVLTADGKRVDVAASDALLARTHVPGQRRGRPEGATEQEGPVAAPVVGRAAAKQAEDRGEKSYARVRTEREGWKAKTDEADYLERVGELVQRKRYDKSLADALGPILSKLESLPARIVSQVGEQEARRVQIVVEREVREVRAEIAAALRALATSTQGQTRQ